MTAVSFEGVEFGDESIREDPYPYYAFLRETQPVYKVPGRNEYLLTRYDDVIYAARHPDLFACGTAGGGRARFSETPPGQRYETVPSLPDNDPPDHTIVREAAYQLFTPGVLRKNEAMMEEEVHSLIDAFADASEVEFVSAFAGPLPCRIVGRLLGVPLDMLPQLQQWTDDYVRLSSGYFEPEEKDRYLRGFASFVNYCGDQVAARRSDPQGDGLTQIAEARRPDGSLFPLEQLAHLVRFLVAAGIDTTTFMLASAMVEGLRRPDAMETFADGSGIAKLVDETLRKESPAAFTPRIAACDIEMGGVTIPAGARVLLVWGSANRDEAQFSQPDVFDPERAERRAQVGFGSGSHFCIGAPLARKEAQITFKALASRFRTIRLSEKNDFRHLTHAIQLRALVELHLDLEKA